ncbi:MAG: hypothetical protein HYZ53_15795 [Planctomycetes bacterium]|nr:hypothetical protein [Planctomycetota bacterium]
MQTDDSPLPKDLLLREATAQQIQLELLRRTQMNALDGASVARDLVAHADKWEAVIFSRPSRSFREPDLITLRDLPDNCWNADTLYVLARDRAGAEWLAERAPEWCSEEAVVLRGESACRALGSSEEGKEVLLFWWD